MNRYAFSYQMSDDVALIRETVPQHVEYWKTLDLPDYIGGPLADRSGGLITFSAEGDEVAGRLASGDPFVKTGAISEYRVRQWMVEPAAGAQSRSGGL